jgi:hypothetical protein
LGEQNQQPHAAVADMTRTTGDLAADAFLSLRDLLFAADLSPTEFNLRPKLNTQDDPLDEYLRDQLSARLTSASVSGVSAPLISPDFVVTQPGLTLSAGESADTTQACAIEVKKLERETARGSGADFNSTPPCGTLTVYTRARDPMAIPGFYFFCVVGRAPAGRPCAVTSASLVDGNILNADASLYEAAINPRTKRISLGTYGDGMDRTRQMYVFANPLSWSWLHLKPTLIHRRNDLGGKHLLRVAKLTRIAVSGDAFDFWCYVARADQKQLRLRKDEITVVDPFHVTAKRVEATAQRGRFILDLPLPRPHG